jgi:membrane associated rhomboid family serine protease
MSWWKLMGFKGYALWLSGISIVMFALQLYVEGFTGALLLDSGVKLEVWRYLTAIFLHGGIGHLAYNVFALVLFGSILEKLIGGKRFLIVFFVTGILANLISVWFYSSSLGASGAIFGVIGALVLVRPGLPIWAFGLPMPMFVAGILWAAGDLIGAVAFLSGNAIGNTGNIAHLSGMLWGLVFGYFYRMGMKPRFQTSSEGVRGGIRYRLDERSMRMWEDQHMRDDR